MRINSILDNDAFRLALIARLDAKHGKKVGRRRMRAAIDREHRNLPKKVIDGIAITCPQCGNVRYESEFQISKQVASATSSRCLNCGTRSRFA